MSNQIPIFDSEPETQEQVEEKQRLKSIFADMEKQQPAFLDEAGKSIIERVATFLAILFGAAAGNLARGVPLDSDGTFSMAFFTDFTPRGHVGLLDWYTVSVALFAAVALAAHSADVQIWARPLID